MAISLKAVRDKIVSLGNVKKLDENEPQILLAYDQMKIVEFASRNGSVTNRQVRKLLSVSNKTAYQELTKLVSMEVLNREGSGRSVLYRATRS